MSLSSIRWRVREFVLRQLLAVGQDHPLRRSYRLARNLPFVRAAWRMATHGGDNWRDVDRYETRGGTFDAPQAGAETAMTQTASLPFDHPDYFAALVENAQRLQRPYAPTARKVMLVNNGLAAGGAERQIVYTLKGLRARGVDAVFVGEYLHRAAGLDFHLRSLLDAGVDVQGLERATQPGRALFQHVTAPVASLLSRAPTAMMLEILDMVAALRAQTPAIVHLWQDETSIKHGLAALIAGAPRIVLSGRNLNPTHFEYFAPHMRAAYLALLSDPRVVMSNNSHAGALSYAEWLGVDEDRIVVSYNAVDPSDWPDPHASVRANVRARFDIDDMAPVVAGVFRLSPEKQPLLWLETARALRARLPDAAFFVLGDGPMKAQFLAKAETLQFGGALHFLGERSDVHDILAASDMFLLTSAQEGTPNALLEAQWAGLACVSTDAGGAAEALAEGETGLIVPDATPEALAAALYTVWGDHDFRARGRRSGRAFVCDRFSLDRMIENTLRLYHLA